MLFFLSARKASICLRCALTDKIRFELVDVEDVRRQEVLGVGKAEEDFRLVEAISHCAAVAWTIAVIFLFREGKNRGLCKQLHA